MSSVNDAFDQKKVIQCSQKSALGILDRLDTYVRQLNWSNENQQEFLEAVHRERLTINRLDLKMAVVGVMKAGKSTLINSLVGQELLPSRNTAMTLLPTYIRHQESELDGQYHFLHANYFNQFINEYQEEFARYRQKMNPDDGDNGGGSSIVACQSASGLKAIKEQLLLINDIARFACEDGDNPDILNCLQEDKDFPQVNIAMACLGRQGDETQIGQLVLVDNPGANEAGITEHLKTLVHKQLESAGILLCALDYTSLNNVSDKELRETIRKYTQQYQSRIIVAINKFDQKDHNSMDAVSTKNYVLGELLNGIDLDDSRVYPLSAREAFLALRAQMAFSQEASWEIAHREGWQKDFMKAALGKMVDPEDEIPAGYTEFMKMGAVQLLNGSMQPDLVKGAIEHAYTNAGPVTIISSLVRIRAKLIDNGLLLTLKNKSQDIDKTVSDIRASIDRLEALLNDLFCFKDQLNKKLQSWPVEQQADAKQWVDSEIAGFKWHSQTTIEQGKGLNRRMGSKSQAEEQAKEARRSLYRQAQKDINSLNEGLKNRLSDQQKKLESEIQRDMSEFATRFGSKLEQVAQIKMSTVNFSLNVNSQNFSAEQLIKSQTRKYTKRQPLNVFGYNLDFLPEFTFQNITRTETSYTVDEAEIKTKFAQNIEKQLTDNINSLSKPLEQMADEFIRNLETICRILETDSAQNIKDHELSREDQEQLKEQINQKLADVEQLRSRVNEICTGLELIKGAEK